MFIPPGSGGAWGSGSPGGNGEDSATCRSTQSADSMGTPQSHFKARPRRASSKRTLGESTPPTCDHHLGVSDTPQMCGRLQMM